MAKTDEDLRLERELFVRALMPSMRGDGAARLATLLTPREVPADTILYREGEPPDEFFFLVEGQVVMEADVRRPLAAGGDGHDRVAAAPPHLPHHASHAPARGSLDGLARPAR